MEKGDSRVALWHADIALRAASPAVEPVQLLKVQALSALNRHSEALSESRSLTVEGNASHPDVLTVRAGALYSAGNMQLAERVFQEVCYHMEYSQLSVRASQDRQAAFVHNARCATLYGDEHSLRHGSDQVCLLWDSM